MAEKMITYDISEESNDIDYEPFPECVMTMQEWLEDCELGNLIDYDGYGDQFSVEDGARVMHGGISPSQRRFVNPKATHIIWYNR